MAIYSTIPANSTSALDDHQPVVADLPGDHKSKGATFNRFGLLQTQASRLPLTLYLDDVQYDGKAQDFDADPGWQKGGGGAAPEADFGRYFANA